MSASRRSRSHCRAKSSVRRIFNATICRRRWIRSATCWRSATGPPRRRIGAHLGLSDCISGSAISSTRCRCGLLALGLHRLAEAVTITAAAGAAATCAASANARHRLRRFSVRQFVIEAAAFATLRCVPSATSPARTVLITAAPPASKTTKGATSAMKKMNKSKSKSSKRASPCCGLAPNRRRSQLN
jgi:hypothetical protein